MPYQVAFLWSNESEAELLQKGFRKTEIYVRECPHFQGCKDSEESCKKGDSDFFSMNHPPFQFKTTSYWGAGCE